jgi:citrate lyase subunit beta/citryl-CoA lyase
VLSESPWIRSLLFAPGGSERILGKVFDAGSDAVALDLEDAVPEGHKERARELVARAVADRAGRPGPLTFVRVNGPESGLTRADLEAVVLPGLWGIQFTKLRSPDDLARYADAIGELEAERGLEPGSIRTICSVDSATLVLSLPQLVRATPRMYSVILGGVDFAEDIGVPVSTDMVESLWTRSYGVLVCREAGLRPPLHPPGLDLDDDAATAALLETGRRLGFQGAIALHPKQLPTIHRVFSPTEQDVLWARRVIDAFGDEVASGSAAVQLDGHFIDYAVAKQAERVLARARVG